MSGGGGEVVLLVVVNDMSKKSGTICCVRMSKHMQMVSAHLALYKQLTIPSFCLGLPQCFFFFFATMNN